MATPIIKAQFLLYLPLIKCLIILPSTAVASALSNCQVKCGNINIPYPFGTTPGCHRDGFNITCDNSTIPAKAFLGSEPTTRTELIDINLTSGEARVYKSIGYNCYNKIDNIYDSFNNSHMNLTDFPHFLISNRRNKFTAIGCYTMAIIVGNKGNGTYQSGCASFCESLISTTENGSCNGLGCCQTSIPAGLTYYEVQWDNHGNNNWEFNPCNYGMLVEEDWYKFRREDLSKNNFLLKNQNGVPLVLDWAIRDSGTCQNGVEKSHNRACLSKNSICNNTNNGKGYLCQCLHGFEGNPYIEGGCIDIDECTLPDIYTCHGNCRNTEGSYKCSCRSGTKGNPKIANCTDNFPLPAKVAIACILGLALLLAVCVLLVCYQQHKSHMKEKEEYNRYYQMMDNHLRVFSKKQIQNATDSYSNARVLGTGGQGNVYQGLLENNQVVAIKKAKEVEERQRGEFVNEIILLSQINHKNIVRLLGCCLEVKIPILVYEFFPNGALFDFLHRNRSRRSISLGTWLKIALDSAVALDYLHTSISCSIIHGDVKSANILLDADYTVKVSDFGASSSVPVNEIVELIHFSHGYVDPECFYTEIITKKSDVYSFGVVMLELLTRKEAVYIDEKGEKQPLATTFLSKAKKNEQLEMLDVELVTNDENVMKVLEEISEIALQCLCPKGEDRPTMEQVVEELQKLVRFHNSFPGQEIDHDEMESLLTERKFPSISDASGTQYSAILEISTGAPR